MKSLVIGIFVIVVVGVLFFVFQLVSNSGFANVTKVTQTVSKDKETFIDINRNISFDYPKGWLMHDPKNLPGYAPILKNKNQNSDNGGGLNGTSSAIGYIALATSPLAKNENIASDIEIYSSELPIMEALATLTGVNLDGSESVNIQEVKRQTYKSGLSGFTVTYSSNGAVGTVFNGTVYFYYTRNGLEYAFSLYIDDAANAQAAGGSQTAAQNFLNQAHEALTHMFAY